MQPTGPVASPGGAKDNDVFGPVEKWMRGRRVNNALETAAESRLNRRRPLPPPPALDTTTVYDKHSSSSVTDQVDTARYSNAAGVYRSSDAAAGCRSADDGEDSADVVPAVTTTWGRPRVWVSLSRIDDVDVVNGSGTRSNVWDGSLRCVRKTSCSFVRNSLSRRRNQSGTAPTFWMFYCRHVWSASCSLILDILQSSTSTGRGLISYIAT